MPEHRRHRDDPEYVTVEHIRRRVTDDRLATDRTTVLAPVADPAADTTAGRITGELDLADAPTVELMPLHTVTRDPAVARAVRGRAVDWTRDPALAPDPCACGRGDVEFVVVGDHWAATCRVGLAVAIADDPAPDLVIDYGPRWADTIPTTRRADT